MSNCTDHTIRILTAFALLASFACAKPLPEKAPLAVSPVEIGSREQRDVSNVVVLSDGSGSMYMAKTFPESKSLSQSFVKAMPDKNARGVGQYDAGFIGFGGEERETAPLAAFDRSALSSAAQRTHIMGQLDGTGGTTPIVDLIDEVGEQLEGRSGKTAVVLFSDGVATRPTDALAAAMALSEARPDPVCFHGVQVGDDPVGRKFLTELAGVSTCGSVRSASEVNSPSALQQYAKSVMVGPAMAAAPVTKPVAPSACSGTIRLRGIEFAFDKADIDPVGAVVLDAAAGTLSNCPNISLSVNGHTDSVGAESYNQALSERRAGAVRGYLVNAGIDPRRLTTRGFGESQPVADNATADGRARNRRVELKPR